MPQENLIIKIGLQGQGKVKTQLAALEKSLKKLKISQSSASGGSQRLKTAQDSLSTSTNQNTNATNRNSDAMVRNYRNQSMDL